MNALHIYSDGVCRGNPGPASIAFIIEAAKEYTKGNAYFYCDSKLVIKQMSGQWKIKKKHIQKLHEKAKKMEAFFIKVTYTQLPREHKKIVQVDALANEALDRN